jgi:hypothetical protein
VLARRLRSQLSSVVTLGVDPWVVGCGYGARASGGSEDIQVVRISDGWSWLIPNQLQAPGFVATRALGLTCDEIFVWGVVDGTYSVARIRLDSLGPGLPPD